MNALALQKILTFFDIDPNLSPEIILEKTQSLWLRPALSERWHLIETFNAVDKKYLLQLFNELGMVDAIFPTRKNYDYFLFMGGDLLGMQERLEFMLNLWQKDIRAKKIVFLTAQRALDPIHEVGGKSNNVHTECDLLKLLFSQIAASLDIMHVEPQSVNTPNQIRNGKSYRATTPDTVIEWLKQSPKSGSCLIITSQPLIGYQESVVRTLLDGSFSIESCGPQADNTVSTAEFLDTLARWLYQERLRRKIFHLTI